MTTLEELYEKIMSDDSEKRALAQALATKEAAGAFLAERGCEATPEELAAYLRDKAGASVEATDEALEGAAGGATGDWIISIFLVGFGCAFLAGMSAVTSRKKTRVNENPTFDLCDD